MLSFVFFEHIIALFCDIYFVLQNVFTVSFRFWFSSLLLFFLYFSIQWKKKEYLLNFEESLKKYFTSVIENKTEKMA